MDSKHIAAAALSLFLTVDCAVAEAGLLSPDNLQECFISRLSGVRNDTVAQQVAAQCLQQFGEGGRIEKQTGWFAKYRSGQACTLAEAKDTPSEFAAQVIQANCYLLYEPSAGG